MSHCTRQTVTLLHKTTATAPQHSKLLPTAFSIQSATCTKNEYCKCHAGTWRSGGTAPTLMSSALGRGKCHLRAPGFFAPWETDLNTHWKRGQVCPKIMWALRKRNICHFHRKSKALYYGNSAYCTIWLSWSHCTIWLCWSHCTTRFNNVRTIQLIRDSHFGKRTWKFNNAKAKSLQRVTSPFPTTSNSPSRWSNLILSCHFFLVFQADVFQDGERKCCMRFYPHYKTITGFSISLS
jgi:hypothetical protein